MTEVPDVEASACPLCGTSLVHIIPGRTTVEDIVQFQKTASRFRGLSENDFDLGWLHPGAYCPACEYVVIAEYAIPGTLDMCDNRPIVVVLVDPGPARLKVISIIRTELGFSPMAARDLANTPNAELLHLPPEHAFRAEVLHDDLTALGATVRIERREE